jgi:hypothetical protein
MINLAHFKGAKGFSVDDMEHDEEGQRENCDQVELTT